MGAGASTNGADSSEIFAQLMMKWDTLAKEPEYALDINRPGRPGALPLGICFTLWVSPDLFLASGDNVSCTFCAGNYDELLKIAIPAKGPEREFFLAMREHFQELVGEVRLMEYDFAASVPLTVHL